MVYLLTWCRISNDSKSSSQATPIVVPELLVVVSNIESYRIVGRFFGSWEGWPVGYYKQAREDYSPSIIS